MPPEPAAMQMVIAITAPGGPEVLLPRQMPVPVPAEDEILIEVHAAGINRHDLNQRQRGPSEAHSDVPGLEVAGIVRGTGRRVTGWQEGDRVCALTDGGGYAQYAVANAGHAFAVRQEMDFLQAAALPEALFTIWHNFFGLAALGAGESVLLHGGTSGVGTIAIQLLTRLGHPVFATCGTPEKLVLAASLGAAAVFDYHHDDFAQGVLRATQGRGVDVILDMSGGQYSEQNLAALARRGRMLHLSPGNGADFKVKLRAIMAKEAKITGSLLRPLPGHEKTAIAGKIRDHILPHFAAGAIEPVIRRVFPLRAAPAAHAAMAQQDHFGKLLLDCRSPDEE
jgi:putative PIG3 family NAD(P)H quinone oxidoreductase